MTTKQSFHQALKECETTGEVKNLVWANIDVVAEDDDLLLMMANRIHAIEMLNLEKAKSYKTQIN